MNSHSILKLNGLTKSFGGVQALADVSFDLQAGEVHALVGENGAGKSTLVKIITGAHKPDGGTIEFAGRPIGVLDCQGAKDLGIAAIYQQPALFPDLSVAENIAFGVEPPGFWRRVNWRGRRERAAQILAEVGAHIDPDVEAGQLAMPQQQLVEIAKALSAQARVLILDEPTASLSDTEIEHLFTVIRQLRGQGVALIYISHRLDELPQIADRVTALRDGRLAGTARVREVSRTDLVRMMVGRVRSAEVPKAVVPSSMANERAGVSQPNVFAEGRPSLAACRQNPQAARGEVLLETRGVSCRAGGIRGVHLALRAGEIVGLAGLVGAGRTEFARVLFGLTPADDGDILIGGTPVVIDSPARAIALGIAYLPEDRRRHGVILELSVAANTSLALLKKMSRRGLFDFARERRLAGDFVHRLGIKTPSIDAPVSNLSGGNQQKVALARWLATNPSLLILDEPTQGIDVGSKAEIHRLMGELAARGMGVLMISSELPEILAMSDRIVVMHAGTIVGQLERAEATQESVLELALGHVAVAEQRDQSPSTILNPASGAPRISPEMGNGP